MSMSLNNATLSFEDSASIENVHKGVLGGDSYTVAEIAPLPPNSQPHFSLCHLPAEIRLHIYNSYFSSLPAFDITPANASSPLHHLTNLIFASPFLKHDIPMKSFYQNATFRFSSGEAMKTFAAHSRNRENVRNVSVRYGLEKAAERKGRDWVFLLSECFERLESVEFEICGGRIIDGEKGGGGEDGGFVDEKGCGVDFICDRCKERHFSVWWKAVVGAFREGRAQVIGKEKLRLSCVRGMGMGIEVLL